MKKVQPQAQTNNIIVLSESSVVQLSFNIKGYVNGVQQVFVSNEQGNNSMLLTPKASELKKSSLQQFTLYRKGNPAEKLVFDVRFKVEKES